MTKKTLIARRVSKGNNPMESAALLEELLKNHTGCTLVLELCYNNFATEHQANRFLETLGS